jgi:hypothetical protein
MIARSLLIAFACSALGFAQTENPAPAKPAATALRFIAYDVNPKKPKDVTVQIRVDQRTHFQAVGESIAGTNYKIQSFERKETAKPDGTKEDVSEITLLDTKTNEKKVLSIGRPIESARAE